MIFNDLIQLAQKNELEDFDKKVASERKQAEALRLQAYPGSISGTGLLADPSQDTEAKILGQIDEINAAARRAEKEAKNGPEKPDAAFPPPPFRSPG